MRIDELFDINVAKSKSTDDYSVGEVAFVTNSTINNGVAAYVEPFDGDKVFNGPAICVSGLGFATVHFSQFLPKGNGGDSCTVLTPKMAMRRVDLIYYAALFNCLHGWRFSFGRKASSRRLSPLVMNPLHSKSPISLFGEVDRVNDLMSTLLKQKEMQLKS